MSRYTHERIDAPIAWQDLLTGTVEAVQHQNEAIEPTPFPRANRPAGPRALFPAPSIRSTTAIGG